MTSKKPVKMIDLEPQIGRLRFDEEGLLLLEIADPPGSNGEQMQWTIITGRESVVGLAHAILRFIMENPEEPVSPTQTEN